MTIGLKVAEGREAEVYTWDGDAVLKLYRPGYLGHAAEAAALAALEAVGVAPRLLGMAEIDDRHGLILERLDGPDMLALLERRPRRMLELARTLAQAHVAVNRAPAPAELPDLKQTLAVRIEAGVESLMLRDFVLRVLDRLPSGDQLCHGDLHPGNILVGPGRASVIDWANATRGVPEADFARTLLLLQRADPLPGTSLLFRGLMSSGRAMFARAYARAYRRRSPDPLKHVQSWAIVQAAARLNEGIQLEAPRLIAFLEQARRKAGLFGRCPQLDAGVVPGDSG